MEGTRLEQDFKEILPFWEEIPDSDREYICRNSGVFAYKKGAHIHDGNDCSGVIFVRSGSLRLYMMSPRCSRYSVISLPSSDII